MSTIGQKGSSWNAEDTILVQTVEELKAVVKQSGIVWVKSHSTLGDGGYGSFTFDSVADRTTADGGTIIDPTDTGTGTGCWVRQYLPEYFTLGFFGVANTTENLLESYGVDEATVRIFTGSGYSAYTFDSSKVGDHNGTTNINGWILQSYGAGGSTINFKGEFVDGSTYIQNDLVTQSGYSSIANKTTTDSNVPVNVGTPYYQFTGVLGETTAAGKQLITGIRKTVSKEETVVGYSVSVVAGNEYTVYSVSDPLGTPIFKELSSFEANSSGKREIAVQPTTLIIGTVFDVVVLEREPNPIPTLTSINFNYTTPKSDGIPGTGVILHSTDNPEFMQIHKTDSDGGNQATFLDTLQVGDVVNGGGLSWSIQVITDNTTYLTLQVAPTANGNIGIQEFIFETTQVAPITHGFTSGGFSTNPSVQGIYALDTAYANASINNNVYDIDILTQDTLSSLDWDHITTPTAVPSPAPEHNVSIVTVLDAKSYSTQEPTGLDAPLQLTFGAAQEASNEVTIDAAGVITFHTGGNYSFNFGLQPGRTTGAGTAILLGYWEVNGTPAGNSISATMEDSTFSIPFRTNFNYELPAGAQVTMKLVRDGAGVNNGGVYSISPTLSSIPDTPSTSVVITKYETGGSNL